MPQRKIYSEFFTLILLSFCSLVLADEPQHTELTDRQLGSKKETAQTPRVDSLEDLLGEQVLYDDSMERIVVGFCSGHQAAYRADNSLMDAQGRIYRPGSVAHRFKVRRGEGVIDNHLEPLTQSLNHQLQALVRNNRIAELQNRDERRVFDASFLKEFLQSVLESRIQQMSYAHVVNPETNTYIVDRTKVLQGLLDQIRAEQSTITRIPGSEHDYSIQLPEMSDRGAMDFRFTLFNVNESNEYEAVLSVKDGNKYKTVCPRGKEFAHVPTEFNDVEGLRVRDPNVNPRDALAKSLSDFNQLVHDSIQKDSELAQLLLDFEKERTAYKADITNLTMDGFMENSAELRREIAQRIATHEQNVAQSAEGKPLYDEYQQQRSSYSEGTAALDNAEDSAIAAKFLGKKGLSTMSESMAERGSIWSPKRQAKMDRGSNATGMQDFLSKLLPSKPEQMY